MTVWPGGLVTRTTPQGAIDNWEQRAVNTSMMLMCAEGGSVTLVGEAPERLHVSVELLNDADPAVLVKLNDRGDIMFTLANAVLWYRRVGLVDGDSRVVEFERTA